MACCLARSSPPAPVHPYLPRRRGMLETAGGFSNNPFELKNFKVGRGLLGRRATRDWFCRMRLLVTADLHYNHPRSQALAMDLISQMNRAGGDVLLVVGDTAVADGDALEQCLGLFRFDGPK